MHLPYSRYLIWLNLIGMSKEAILSDLEDLSLPVPTPHLLDEYVKLAEKTPLSTMTKRRIAREEFNTQDQGCFERLGFGELYTKRGFHASLPNTTQRAWLDCRRLLKNPIARVAVDCCLIAGFTFEEIRQLVQFTHELEITDPGFEFYTRTYFDYQGQTKSTWKEYLTLISDNYSYTRYFAALTQSKNEVLHLVGLPTKPAFGEFLKKVLSKADYKFSLYSNQNTHEGDEEARRWAKVGIDAGVKYDKFSAADMTDFSAVLQTEFEYVEEEIESITGEMLAEVKPVEAEDSKSKAPVPAVCSPDLEV